jgi:hypothetical protein
MIKQVLAGAAVAAALALGAVSPASAAILFCNGGGCTSQGETVHLGGDNGTAGSPGGANQVIGDLQSGAFTVLIDSNEPISTSSDGNGQAWIIPNDFVEGVHSGPANKRTPDTGGLNFLSFSLVDATFTSLEFRVTPIDTNNPGPTAAWTLTLNGFDANNVAWSDSFDDLGKNEFFNIYAVNGQRITSANFTMPTNQGAIQKVAQIRIGGAERVVIDTPVPEPGTWALMIIGFGGAGAMLRQRRHRLVKA